MQNVLIRPQSQWSQVLQPSGSLNANTALQFQAQLNAAVLSEHHSSLVVDLGAVESIDSAGLMTLVSALKIAQRLNKRFILCSASHPIRMVLEMTQLDGVFEIAETLPAF